MNYKGLNIVPKFKIENKKILSYVYTPGVGSSCMSITEERLESFICTNRSNSVAVISENYSKALERAIFLKKTLFIDAYPLCIKNMTPENLKFIVNNIEPNFNAIDLTCVAMYKGNLHFNVKIPVLKNDVKDLKSFFFCFARPSVQAHAEVFVGDINEKSLRIREFHGGVIKTRLSEKPLKKPVAIISDGSAVLGFGNIGAEAALPVMEGKSVLFKTLGDVNAMPLCIKTQDPLEIIKLVLLLEDSFSAVNLEDISAPRCFEIEDKLKEKSEIVIFHDDQHGTAIVVLAALLNSLKLAEKNIEDIKVVFSGAGAAAQAVCKLLLKAGVKNIIMNDINGSVYAGRKVNDKSLEKISQFTNLEQIKGTLKNTIKGADVFIGLSAPNVLTPQMIKTMAEKPIIFALANPTPEIDPKRAKKAGAFIVATGRSDFENQVNNSLAFPGLFKGVLEKNLNQITDEMKLICAKTIASLVNENELSVSNIIPDPLNNLVPQNIAKNIAQKYLNCSIID